MLFEQVAFGKCDREWMIAEQFCELSCGRCLCNPPVPSKGVGEPSFPEQSSFPQENGDCAECFDVAPDEQFTCAEQVGTAAAMICKPYF